VAIRIFKTLLPSGLLCAKTLNHKISLNCQMRFSAKTAKKIFLHSLCQFCVLCVGSFWRFCVYYRRHRNFTDSTPLLCSELTPFSEKTKRRFLNNLKQRGGARGLLNHRSGITPCPEEYNCFLIIAKKQIIVNPALLIDRSFYLLSNWIFY